MSRNFELLTQLEAEVPAPALPTKPKANGPVVIALERSDSADAGRDETLRLVQRVFLSTNGSGPRQVVFCGAEGDNGSSDVCASAGRTLAANTSLLVCLVDAHVRSPRLSRMFAASKTSSSSGISDPGCDKCVQIDGNLWLAGTDLLTDNHGSLLSVEELRDRLAQLQGRFEFVLIDAPGAAVSGDAAILGKAADAVILVIEANSTRRLTARRAKETLDAAGVRLLGTVLHNRKFPIPRGLYKRL